MQPTALAGAAVMGAALLLAGCAAPRAPADPGSAGKFVLESPGRADNDRLTPRYGGKNAANPNCAGDNVSPALAWSNPPAGTRSFALVVDDQAGRAGLGVSHFVAYGMAPTLAALSEGEASAPTPRFVPGKNVIGTGVYFGPCPPRTDAPHHYVFTLIATSLEPDALAPGLTQPELLNALKGKALGATGLVLRYGH